MKNNQQTDMIQGGPFIFQMRQSGSKASVTGFTPTLDDVGKDVMETPAVWEKIDKEFDSIRRIIMVIRAPSGRHFAVIQKFSNTAYISSHPIKNLSNKTYRAMADFVKRERYV